MNIYYLASNPIVLPEHKIILDQLGALHIVPAKKWSEDQLISGLQEADILIVHNSAVEKISAKVLQALPKLKFITTTSAGYHWIDVVTAKEQGIVVSNCKGANAQSVAEHVWALILNLAKHLGELDRDVRQSSARNIFDYTGIEISGKTLGIIGLGEIGSRVAKIASGFGVDVLGYNRSVKKISNVKQVELDELFKQSDIIAITIAQAENTKNIINHSVIEKMKTGVILVNISGSKVVEKEALLGGLKSKKIFGLGIELESDTESYLEFPNVIATPHHAFNTVEANKRVKDAWVANVQAFVAGQPINIV